MKRSKNPNKKPPDFGDNTGSPSKAKSSASGNDEATGKKFSQQQKEIKKFVLETCTKLVFVSLQGEKREIMLKKRILSYVELQTDIARYNKKSAKNFIVQDAYGNLIPDKPFLGYDEIRVKEVGIQPKYSVLKELMIRWENETYYVNNPDSDLRVGLTAIAPNKVVVDPNEKAKTIYDEDDEW